MSQFMKSETRPALDAVLLFIAQDYALRVILYNRKGLGRDRAPQ